MEFHVCMPVFMHIVLYILYRGERKRKGRNKITILTGSYFLLVGFLCVYKTVENVHIYVYQPSTRKQNQKEKELNSTPVNLCSV